MSEITIRPATVSDAEAVYNLEVQCFSAAWSYNLILSSIADSSYMFYIAFVDGVPAGYCSGMAIIDELHIMNICVSNNFRRMGIAKKLMLTMLRTAKMLSANSATLEVRVSNFPAITMYERLGFKKEGIRKKYYPDNNEDALIMWCGNSDLW